VAKRKPARSAIVADRRSLERGLSRVLLEERGFVVVEADTLADVLLHIQLERPDVVVLHKQIALEHDPAVIAQIRRISSDTRIVLLASADDVLPLDLTVLSDIVVEEGHGLAELAMAVVGLIGEPPRDVVDGRSEVAEGSEHGTWSSGRRWADRLQGLAVASIIALAFVIARDMTNPPLSPPPTPPARTHLLAAWDSLEELEQALPDAASAQEVVFIARRLFRERAVARAAGADVSELDDAIWETLGPLLSSLPEELRDALIAILGVLVTGEAPPADDGPPPTPSTDTEPPHPGHGPPPKPKPDTEPTETETISPSPSPSETISPSPSPSETISPSPSPSETISPSPSPSETISPSPSPSETISPSPSPSETISPSPSPSETISPSPSPSDTISPNMPAEGSGSLVLVVPPALTLLLAMSGWARRRSRRIEEERDETLR
jgi:hypothetical protein